MDSETGLYYYRARYYDSTTGRFLEEDPIRFQGGMNFYPYAQNDPIGLNDPFGLCPSPDKCDAKLPSDADAAILSTTRSMPKRHGRESPLKRAQRK